MTPLICNKCNKETMSLLSGVCSPCKFGTPPPHEVVDTKYLTARLYEAREKSKGVNLTMIEVREVLCWWAATH